MTSKAMSVDLHHRLTQELRRELTLRDCLKTLISMVSLAFQMGQPAMQLLAIIGSIFVANQHEPDL
jgi:hypothetical protein